MSGAMDETIEWKEEYAIGNEMVDREHRELLRLIGLIMAAAESDQCGDAVDAAFGAFRRYVDRHFQDEEDLLEAAESEHLPIQRAEHRVLKQELETLWTSELLGDETKIREMAVWGKQRLLRHFLTTDARAFNDFPFREKEGN
ncbi:MAG: hemerythrin family protein [Rhodospirillales bacterium]|nr:hemerythrin family protein [Rhodospirillales bacterium]MCW8862872.1 hemerythrin family protein [Rhodospirillales bacterium]MCW8952048.1 hemerythrin family protein [Rhodospirillales bacterium]MCW9001387.1 hemerythrin family protein [Rhodospirillales bacterium]